MGKRLILLSLFILMLIGTSGCWDRAELESLGLVQALGLDLAENGKDIIVTTMIAIPSKLGATSQGGGAGEGPGVALISMPAPSIYEAFNLINTTLNREVTLLQNQVLILGEHLTKHGVHRWIDTLIRFREMRRTLLIYTCQGKASDIIKVQPEIDPNPAEYFRDLSMLSKITGMFPQTTLHNFMRSYEAYTQQNYAPLIAPYQKKEETEAPKAPGSNGGGDSGGSEGGGKKEEKAKAVRFIGTTVFNKDKAVGNLDLYESQILLILTNQFHQAYQTIEDPLKKGTYVVFQITPAKPIQIKYTQKDVAHFKVKVSMEANILSIQSGVDYSKSNNEKILTRNISKTLENRIRKVINKTQQKFKSDIFGFGAKVRNTMLTSTQWDNYHWADKYPAAKFSVNVITHVRRIGVQFQPPEERE